MFQVPIRKERDFKAQSPNMRESHLDQVAELLRRRGTALTVRRPRFYHAGCRRSSRQK
jgi:hypothetical protein